MKKLYAYFVFSLFCLSASAQLVTLNGAGPVATQAGSVYTLTRSDIYFGGQANSLWEQTQISLANPFTVCARLNFGVFSETNPDPNNPNGLTVNGLPFSTGADGIAFVLAPQPYTGETGEEIGYGSRDLDASPFIYTPISSFAVEFDTWQNIQGSGAADLSDPVQDHMAFNRAGLTSHTGINAVTPVVNLGEIETGDWYNVSISWSPVTGMSVNFNGTIMTTSAADVIASFGGNPNAMVNWGFTAATGMGTNVQQVELITCPSTGCTLTVSTTLPALGCGPANYLYLGYGPQEITAMVNIEAGTTFQWYRNGVMIGGATDDTYAPTMPGIYHVVATNGNCTASTEGAATQVVVIDIRCGKENQNKVYVCHKPNGNGNGINGTNGGPNTLCVAVSAVPAHLAHGDCLGMCGQVPSAKQIHNDHAEVGAHVDAMANIFPNPSRGSVQVKLNEMETERTEIQIINSKGVMVERRMVVGNASSLTFNLKKYGTGMFVVKIINGSNVEIQKMMVQD